MQNLDAFRKQQEKLLNELGLMGNKTTAYSGIYSFYIIY